MEGVLLLYELYSLFYYEIFSCNKKRGIVVDQTSITWNIVAFPSVAPWQAANYPVLLPQPAKLGKLRKFMCKNVLSSCHLIKTLIELLVQLQNERPVSIVREWWAGFVHLLMVQYLRLLIREMAVILYHLLIDCVRHDVWLYLGSKKSRAWVGWFVLTLASEGEFCWEHWHWTIVAWSVAQ
jgi:hypothetical protein